MKGLAAEFAIIVSGILLALAVDEWRQDRRNSGSQASTCPTSLRSSVATCALWSGSVSVHMDSKRLRPVIIWVEAISGAGELR
jgi:hypothetical protein